MTSVGNAFVQSSRMHHALDGAMKIFSTKRKSRQYPMSDSPKINLGKGFYYKNENGWLNVYNPQGTLIQSFFPDATATEMKTYIGAYYDGYIHGSADAKADVTNIAEADALRIKMMQALGIDKIIEELQHNFEEQLDALRSQVASLSARE
jgi:hypothetical protein